MKIGLLHPGAMGASIGLALQANGHEVLWAADGRSADTKSRASAFANRGSVERLAQESDAIISICPPEFARSVAEQVAALGFAGIYVDANAVSPATARNVHAIIGEAYVDGGVIGPPPVHPGTTRLYLSGTRAAEVEPWFNAGTLDAFVLGGDAVAASTLKMCYAAWTKGSAALLLSIRALADSNGVTSDLMREWDISQPGLAQQSEGAALGTAPKAWRFVAEMREIAQTFASAGLPDDFHRGAAAVYERLSGLKSVAEPDFQQVLDALRASRKEHV